MAHAQKPDLVFQRNGRVHLYRRGCQFSRLLVAEVCSSAVVMLDRPCSDTVQDCWLPTPFASFPFTSPPVLRRVPPDSISTLPYCSSYFCFTVGTINHLTPNDHYSGRTAPLTSKRCILYIYSTNTGTEYFKHGINSPFFPLQNAVCFIILTYLDHILFTFYIQSALKFKKIIPAPKG